VSLLSLQNRIQDNDILDFESDSDYDVDISITKLGLQRCIEALGLYMLGTFPECLYKHAQQAYNNYKEGHILQVEDFAPTASEVAAVEAEVSNSILTKAIEAIKQTVRSGRHIKSSQKAKMNTEQELAFR
jgi:hypothetical protein